MLIRTDFSGLRSRQHNFNENDALFHRKSVVADGFFRTSGIATPHGREASSLRFSGFLRAGKKTQTTRAILQTQERNPRFRVDRFDTTLPLADRLYGKHRATRVVVLGAAGHLYNGNPKLQVEQRLNHLQGHDGTLHGPDGQPYRFLYDPAFFVKGKDNRPVIGPDGKPLIDPAIKPHITGERLASLKDMPEGSIVMVLSPTGLHARQLETLLRDPEIKGKIKGIYCEKSMVTTIPELATLEKTLKETDTPVYFVDHVYEAAIGVMALLGKPMR